MGREASRNVLKIRDRKISKNQKKEGKWNRLNVK